MMSGGKINALAFRPVSGEVGGGGALELYSAHGDGRICAWMPRVPEGLDDEQEDGERKAGEDTDEDAPLSKRKTKEEDDAEKSRKRKRDLIEGLVEGLTRKPITFS